MAAIPFRERVRAFPSALARPPPWRSNGQAHYQTALEYIDTVLKREDEYRFFDPIVAMGPVFEEHLGRYSTVEWPIYELGFLKHEESITVFFMLLIMS